MTAVASVLVIAALIVVGLGASLAFLPAGAASLPTRLASVFGLGCAVPAFAATALALVGRFDAASLIVVLTLGTAVSYAIAFRRSSPRDHLAAAHEELAVDRLFIWLGLGAVILIAILWAAVPRLPMAGGWRYWADGLELADRGGVPEFTAQWGDALPPAISKLGGNAFLGALSFVFRDAPFAGMAVALWMSAVGYAAGLLALGRELGLRRTAPALPLLGIAGGSLPAGIVFNGEIAGKLEFYQHEDLGRMLAAVGAAVVVARDGDRPPGWRMVVGGVVLAAGALTHLIPVLAFGALIAGVMIARLATGPERRRVAQLAGGVVAIAAILTAAPLAVAGGDVGFQGAGNPERYVLVEGRYDPTASVKGLSRPPRPKSERRWYESPSTTAGSAVEAAVGRDLSRAGVVGLAIGALAAAVALAVLGGRDLRLLVVGVATMALALVAAGLVFSYRYSVYAQGTFGERRLFEYGSVPLMLLALAVVELGAARLASRRTVVGSALALATVVVVAIASVGDLGVAGTGKARYLAAAVTTPCDSRLLVEGGRTRGSFQALSGRISITEGLEPFLRPSIVNDVLEVRAAKARFLRNPDRFSVILTRREVDFVIARERPRLNGADELELVRDLDGIGVYEVKREEAGDTLPSPSGSPGYHCFREVPY